MLGEVEAAARLLSQRADARTLRALSSTIHGIATDPKRHAAIRASASAVMKTFSDPALLAPIALRLLQRSDDADAARALVLDAGPAGAYALYGARVKLAAEPAVREPFVATMRALGESSWPVVRAALERIPATALTGEHPRAAELAEDLLWSVPVLRDDAAGALVAKYVRTTQASLCRAATQALGRLWAERAAPLLLALLEVQDDGVRLAAIAGLRQIGAVDELVVHRLMPILTRKIAAGDELRLAAVAALEFVTPDARPVAVPILVKLVRDLGPEDATVLAASRALLSVMGNEARAVIIDRSDRAGEPLKSHLLVLLRDPKLPEVDAKTVRALG
jgi:serine/threonine-protein kinase